MLLCIMDLRCVTIILGLSVPTCERKRTWDPQPHKTGSHHCPNCVTSVFSSGNGNFYEVLKETKCVKSLAHCLAHTDWTIHTYWPVLKWKTILTCFFQIEIYTFLHEQCWAQGNIIHYVIWVTADVATSAVGLKMSRNPWFVSGGYRKSSSMQNAVSLSGCQIIFSPINPASCSPNVLALPLVGHTDDVSWLWASPIIMLTTSVANLF